MNRPRPYYEAPLYPLPAKSVSVEEEESPYHDDIKEFTSLEDTCGCGDTAQYAPAAAGCVAGKEKELRVVYVMTDGAALPLPLSRMVRTLRKRIIAGTVTTGHAFGGDLESVTSIPGDRSLSCPQG